MMKFRTQVKTGNIARSSDQWTYAGPLFDTVDQAIAYAREFSTRWTDVYAWRVVDTISNPLYTLASEGN